MYTQRIFAQWWWWALAAGMVSLGCGPMNPAPGDGMAEQEDSASPNDPEADSDLPEDSEVPYDDTEAPTFPCSDFAPYDEDGRKWFYRDGDYSWSITSSVAADGTFQATAGDWVELLRGLTLQYTQVDTYICDAEGTKIVRQEFLWPSVSGTYVYDPPVLLMPLELTPGAEWSVEYEARWYEDAELLSAETYSSTFHVGAVEDVEVDAGTFTASQIWEGDTSEDMTWHVRGIGLVKGPSYLRLTGME